MANTAAMRRRERTEAGRDRAAASWLIDQLRARFYLGQLSAGARLPPVRQLARQIQASPTTVHQIYKELEGEGLVEARERSGTFLKGVASECRPTPGERAAYKLVRATAARLQTLDVSPADFCRSLLLASGARARTDFKFGFVTMRETCEMLEPQIRKTIGHQVPVVHIAPDDGQLAAARMLLARDRAIGCLLTTYLFSPAAVRLARESGLPVVVIQLHPATAAVLEPPHAGTRWILTRDVDCAEAFTRLIAAVGTCPDRVRAVGLDDVDRMPDFRAATEVCVSPLAWKPAQVLLPPGARICRLSTEVSQRTIEDVAFHYLFAEDRRGGEGRVVRPSAACW